MLTRTKCRHIVLGCVAVFTILAIYSHYEQMTSWEISLFSFFNNLPSYLGNIFTVATLLGSSWMVGAVCILLLASNKVRLAIYVMILSIVTFGLTEIMKNIVARPRPFVLLQNVPLRTDYIESMGFPSGHTAIVTVVALMLLPHIPKKLKWSAPLAIVLVGISRMYLGVHAPLDILGGFLLGVIVYHTSKLLKPKLKKTLKKINY